MCLSNQDQEISFLPFFLFLNWQSLVPRTRKQIYSLSIKRSDLLTAVMSSLACKQTLRFRLLILEFLQSMDFISCSQRKFNAYGSRLFPMILLSGPFKLSLRWRSAFPGPDWHRNQLIFHTCILWHFRPLAADARMTVLQMLPEMICSRELLSLVQISFGISMNPNLGSSEK